MLLPSSVSAQLEATPPGAMTYALSMDPGSVANIAVVEARRSEINIRKLTALHRTAHVLSGIAALLHR